MAWRLAATALAVAVFAPSSADCAFGDVGFISGNNLYGWCASTSDIDRNYCVLYLLGLADAQTDRQAIGNAAFCVPSGVLGSQLREVVYNYMAANPAYRHLSASALASIALHAAYPCQTVTPSRQK